MTKTLLVAVLLAASSSIALAQPPVPQDGSLTGKAMHDLPGHTGGGTTANPTAKPDDSSLTAKAMKDSPGVTGGGSTSSPTSKADDGSLTGKAMKDLPGNR